jgi:hypothetical protein
VFRQVPIMTNSTRVSKIWVAPLLASFGWSLPADARHHGKQSRRFAISQPGIFSAGEVRAGSVKRAASSVGEGPQQAISSRVKGAT